MCRPRAFDHDAALELWERRELTTPAIARKVAANPGTVHSMIKRLRERGDHRAVRRYLIDGVKKLPARP